MTLPTEGDTVTSPDDVQDAVQRLLDAVRRRAGKTSPDLAFVPIQSYRDLRADLVAVHPTADPPVLILVQMKTSATSWQAEADTMAAAGSAEGFENELSLVAHLVSALAQESDVPSSEALHLLQIIVRGALAERRRTGQIRRDLAGWLTPSLAELDPVPRSAVEQARRLASLRSDLLATGAFTYEALAEGRGASAPAIRQFVRRAKERRELFTVRHDGETLVPAFLLDAELAPRPALRPAIEALRAAGEDDWALWAWFATPSGWLGGRRPMDVAPDDPIALAIAAERRASNAA